MSSRQAVARHRATPTRTSRLAAISSAVSTNTGTMGRQAAVIAAASGLVLTSGIAANAAAAPAQPEAVPAAAPEAAAPASGAVSAGSNVRISFERPAVSSTPAPVVDQAPEAAPAVEPQAAAVEPAAAPVQVQPAAAAQAPAQPVVSVQAKAAPAPAPAAAGVNAAMVSAAYAQLGITQDCTAMVEKALGAAGIPVGDLAPMQFMNYGSVVGTPQPGDMVVQPGHVGIYVGGGKVLSGGMNGVNETIVHPLSWLTATGPVTFVRPGA
ncbi:C40 family peptidase (plasmid) [Arthrobacter sp. FW305-BF8]|uniref:NlpC/P60 family protein n=1 Tax=Arthrobacter sp. FW305-BF8 TaxID=2879617 RepID=UPI001F39DB14|nr:NlpC/P60 family protein [Arthrobacter sp. FW305-BF8]UKA56721.1 C40 family peptidase [Arthrobacter sp. FW305-BF8]